MKIKIHKGFRGLLSLLVTVMLLVGIMPMSAVKVYADPPSGTAYTVAPGESLTIYFSKNMGNASGWYNNGAGNIYIFDTNDNCIVGRWSSTQSTYVPKEMSEYIATGISDMGYYVHKETYTNNTGSDVYIKGMIFAMQNYWNDDSKQTVDITDIQNNHLYYAIETSDRNGGKYKVAHVPYQEAKYVPISSVQTRTRDKNVVTSGETFNETDSSSTVYKDAVFYDY